MNMKFPVLSEADLKVLRELIVKSSKLLTGGRSLGMEKLFNPGDDLITPEVYVALVPIEGIPPLQFTGVSTGTGTSTSTGTGEGPEKGDEPGYAECDIYRILDVYPNQPELIPVSVNPLRVFNISYDWIPGYTTWVLVQKTKTGEWVATYVPLSPVEVVLGETLAAATNPLTGWTTARAFVYGAISNGNLKFNYQQITVINRYLSVNGTLGCYGTAVPIGGKWLLQTLDCVPITSWTNPAALI